MILEMNKLSVKLGILFFVVIFGLITFMFFFLHTEIVDSENRTRASNIKIEGEFPQGHS